MATVVLAGGGTAGHVEPALAVAREWLRKHPVDHCIFLGTKSGLEATLVPAAGFQLCNIAKVRITREPSISWLRIPLDLISAVVSCSKVLKKADVLVGFGGYVSAPAYLAAAITRTPIVIHEANTKPGWANRLGAIFTQHLAVVHEVKGGRFSQALLTGLPLRSDVVQAFSLSSFDWPQSRKAAKTRLGFSADRPLVFIMGGSQGSVAINNVIAQSISTFNEKEISVLHSLGKLNTLPLEQGSYRPVAYVDAMADAYLAADLIVARSGAVTCSEFRTLGRYALFVPLPIGNGEQFSNAASLVHDGRAQVVTQQEFTPLYISSHIDSLLTTAAISPMHGDPADLNAAEKIASLTEFAIGS